VDVEGSNPLLRRTPKPLYDREHVRRVVRIAEGKHDIFQNDALRSIASKHGETVALVILRWLVQRGVVAIPKSVRKERVAENFDVFDFVLAPEELAAIVMLDTKTSSFFDHRDPKMVKRLGNAKLPT
jgi:2,5-diketo-D-gluconate reductase A